MCWNKSLIIPGLFSVKTPECTVRKYMLLPLYILSLKHKPVMGMYSVPFLSKGSKFNYPKDKRSQQGTKCFAQECNKRVTARHWPHCYTKDTSQKKLHIDLRLS